MIVETNGKKLAFGLEWKLLIKSGSPGTLATKQALEDKARLMWHDGSKLYTGLILPNSKIQASGGTLFAAAEAFTRLDGLPNDALLILRTPDNNYAVIGIKEGRPRRGFDQDGLSEEAAHELFQQFGTVCGESGFAVVGDPTVPFAQSVTPLTLEELAALADVKCALRPPSRAGTYRNIAYVAVTVIAAIVLGPKAKDYFFPPTPEEQKTPTELYQDYVAQHINDPVLRANDFGGWYGWVRSLPPSYGGWSLTKVDCDFRNPASQPGSYQTWNGVPLCSLTYERTVRAVATNETFVKAAPKEFVDGSIYNPSTDTMTVALRPKIVAPTTVRALFQTAKPGTDRDVHFVSDLQHANNLAPEAALAKPVPFLIPPGGNRANIQAPVYMTAGWKLGGQLRYTELLKSFPPYAILSKATLTIDRNTANGDTPYKVALAGEVITNN